MFVFLWKKNVVLAVLALAMETRLVLNSKRSTWLLLSAGIEVTCTHARTRFIHRAPVSFLLHMGWNPGPLTMDRYHQTQCFSTLLIHWWQHSRRLRAIYIEFTTSAFVFSQEVSWEGIFRFCFCCSRGYWAQILIREGKRNGDERENGREREKKKKS